MTYKICEWDSTLGKQVERNATPSEAAEFDARKIPNIPVLKAAKNVEINLARAAANQTTFPYLGKDIACDALSRSDIDAIANSIGLNDTFPVGFPMGWKCVDNTYIGIPDVASFKNMYAAMVAEGTANFNKSQQLKAALANATTEVAIRSIVWS